MIKSVERETQHIEVASIDPLGNKPPCGLYGIAAGLIGEGDAVVVVPNLLRSQLSEENAGLFVRSPAALPLAEGDSGVDGVPGAGELCEKEECFVFVFGLWVNFPLFVDDRIGADDDGVGGRGGDRLGLSLCELFDIARGVAGEGDRVFIKVRALLLKGESEVAHDLSAAGRL